MLTADQPGVAGRVGPVRIGGPWDPNTALERAEPAAANVADQLTKQSDRTAAGEQWKTPTTTYNHTTETRLKPGRQGK